MQEGRHVDDAHFGDVAESVARIVRLDDAGGDLQPQVALLFRRHQPLFQEHGDRADGAVAAHGQAARRSR